MNRLQEKYNSDVVPALRKSFEFKNIMQVPRVDKVVVNIGMGETMDNPKALEAAVNDLTIITGQKPIMTKARKSIANFKLREGMPIGVRVTLRGERMYEFLDRFISIAMPRVRDFRGINDKAFDGRGNFTMGITEQIIFPEIDIDKVSKIMGMDVSFVTSAKTDAEAYALLKEIGIPFVKKSETAQNG